MTWITRSPRRGCEQEHLHARLRAVGRVAKFALLVPEASCAVDLDFVNRGVILSIA
jgi:hypothetical protein